LSADEVELLLIFRRLAPHRRAVTLVSAEKLLGADGDASPLSSA
jgi:hypothetical protein